MLSWKVTELQEQPLLWWRPVVSISLFGRAASDIQGGDHTFRKQQRRGRVCPGDIQAPGKGQGWIVTPNSQGRKTGKSLVKQLFSKRLRCGSDTSHQHHCVSSIDIARKLPFPGRKEPCTSGLLFPNRCRLQWCTYPSVTLQCNSLVDCSSFLPANTSLKWHISSFSWLGRVWQVTGLLLPKSWLWSHCVISFRH